MGFSVLIPVKSAPSVNAPANPIDPSTSLRLVAVSMSNVGRPSSTSRAMSTPAASSAVGINVSAVSPIATRNDRSPNT